jgi:hypothetical protein
MRDSSLGSDDIGSAAQQIGSVNGIDDAGYRRNIFRCTQLSGVGAWLRAHQYIQSIELSFKNDVELWNCCSGLCQERFRLCQFAIRSNTRVPSLRDQSQQMFIGLDLLFRECQAYLRPADLHVRIRRLSDH